MSCCNDCARADAGDAEKEFTTMEQDRNFFGGGLDGSVSGSGFGDLANFDRQRDPVQAYENIATAPRPPRPSGPAPAVDVGTASTAPAGGVAGEEPNPGTGLPKWLLIAAAVAAVYFLSKQG